MHVIAFIQKTSQNDVAFFLPNSGQCSSKQGKVIKTIQKTLQFCLHDDDDDDDKGTTIYRVTSLPDTVGTCQTLNFPRMRP